MAFSGDSKMSEILGNEEAKAILDKHVPGLSSNPQIGQAAGMSLKEVAGYAQAGISPEVLSALEADLSQLA